MTIKIPNNNINERKYIIDIIFKEFLGVDYLLEIASNEYEIILPNKKVLIIKDTFFNRFPNDLDYLKEENIPKSIKELDIFAASFFMLTRWEEYVNKTRDKHNRFPAYASLAYKEGFLDRPIVNEFVESLKQQLLELDKTLAFKERKFKFFLTHDVDMIVKYQKFTDRIKEIVGDIIKRKSFKFAFYNILQLVNLKKDPYDTFNYLMDISEKKNTKSYFFIHSSNSHKLDIDNDKYLERISTNIKKRGHFLGYHPSYDAYNDHELFSKNKEKIENIIKNKLHFGRQHFLRFEVPTTWQIWEDAGMKWDSTLSYADKEGFRCGVCYEFSVFNILTRKKLSLKEKPLVVMDGSFVTYQSGITPEEMEEKIIILINQVKKYNGEFVFLWHNSSFDTVDWKEYKNVYEKVLK